MRFNCYEILCVMLGSGVTLAGLKRGRKQNENLLLETVGINMPDVQFRQEEEQLSNQ